MINTFCETYVPVCLSRQDTLFTQNQVKANEAAFYKQCPHQAAARQCK